MDAPNNPRLVLAIREAADASEADAPDKFRALLDALLESTLLASTQEDALGAVETGHDELYLAVYTDPVELFAHQPGANWTAISAEDVIRKVAEGEFDGFVINVAGTPFEMSREEVEEVFDIDGEDEEEDDED